MLPKTKIWKGGTNDELRMFESTFQWYVAQIGYSRLEKCF